MMKNIPNGYCCTNYLKFLILETHQESLNSFKNGCQYLKFIMISLFFDFDVFHVFEFNQNQKLKNNQILMKFSL